MASLASIDLDYDELSAHFTGHIIKPVKHGYVLSIPEHGIHLIEGCNKHDEKGKWVIKHQNNYSYVAPELFHMISSLVVPDITGQTLVDGTIMSAEKAVCSLFGDEPLIQQPQKRKRVNTSEPRGETKRRKLTDVVVRGSMTKVLTEDTKCTELENKRNSLPLIKPTGDPIPRGQYISTRGRTIKLLSDIERTKRDIDNRIQSDKNDNVSVNFI